MDKEYLIKKWLDDELTETEAEQFRGLEEAGFYEEILKEAKRFKGDVQVKVGSFESLNQKIVERKSPSVNWLKVVSSMAAVFLVAFSIYTFIDRDEINTFATYSRQQETITLPDNSIVSLNEASQLEYNLSQWDDQRILQLQGEAFFDVEKGKRFEVNTAFGKVSVLGTEFNVLSRDESFEVTCYEGLVSVSYNNKEEQLPAGTQLTIIAGKAIKTDVVIAAPVWLHQKSIFENAPLQDVFMELGKQYDIDVQFEYNGKQRFTGVFEHDNLENALKSLTQPFNLTYKINDNQKVVVINGKD